METLTIILQMVGISLLGAFLFTIIQAGKYFKPGIFSARIFLRENKYTWIYAFMVSSVIAVIINVVPNTSDAIKAITGLDVTGEIASFLTLGYALCASIKNKKLPKLRESIGGGGVSDPTGDGDDNDDGDGEN